MKKTLIEELERIHSITYGKDIINEADFINKLINKVSSKFKKTDDPKKADLVSDDVKNFFDTLQSAVDKGGINQQKKGSMTFQKEVESMQIGLILLGYQLPKFGVDGFFGPETASAVSKFVSEKLENKNKINEATLSSPVGKTSVNSPYGPRWGRMHHGVDLAASSGTQIKSPLDGEVLDAKITSNDCGGTIHIQHADGYRTRYCHCKQINITKGQKVSKGDVIGLSGGAPGDIGRGRSDGAHLHFEVYKDGKIVNPEDHLGSEVGEFVAGQGTKMTKASPEMLSKLIELLKQKDIKPEDLKKYIDPIEKKGIQISLNGSWLEITKELLKKHEGFTEKAVWDENAFRGGYGSDKKLVNGKLVKATKDTRWTKQEAEETMGYEIKNFYAPTIAKQLGLENWNKLNDKQKASLVSLGYNAGPYFLTARDYGKKIKSAIEDGNMELAASYIENGPTTGSSSGKVYASLQKRRKEESDIFMA